MVMLGIVLTLLATVAVCVLVGARRAKQGMRDRITEVLDVVGLKAAAAIIRNNPPSRAHAVTQAGMEGSVYGLIIGLFGSLIWFNSVVDNAFAYRLVPLWTMVGAGVLGAIGAGFAGFWVTRKS